MLSFFQETKKHDPQSIGGQKGFTVIEMIVAASLLVTTMTLVVAIFLNSITVFPQSLTKASRSI